MYRCPLCQHPLVRDGQQWHCDQRHSFDIAKQGYVNLLPVQNKRSKSPGDNADMMQARRDFLNAGFYQPLSDQLNQLFIDYLGFMPTPQILDLGCGEGYYSARLHSAFNLKNQAQIWGLDISKDAIRYAAKRDKQIQFCVASAYDLPFSDQAFDGLMRIYAPSLASEIERVTRPGGWLITVQPAADHLAELKQAIYSQPQPHDETPESIQGFELIQQHKLSYEMTLDCEADRLNLLNMTPFGWKLNPEQKQALSHSLVKVKADFLICVQQKNQ
ncbi:MAG: 23S rRNA (guanine(745)-N(1))-methyltransferase [Thiomicrospira sp.]|uniref:23S rRNA (guanine(745)-N(1))-methyltransferase n=1 Tax=Thiomicrospira sp. TaxID=935 RepID=UPI0019E28178|nr:23S rRNA (guanine(745)-N(1))-methyltransferase [Thiomicrospira sp.]MBE0493342.1 23S rRNA (guanine(745)-N(1))-methyltransferase [Thiomicrospira sp.]